MAVLRKCACWSELPFQMSSVPIHGNTVAFLYVQMHARWQRFGCPPLPSTAWYVFPHFAGVKPLEVRSKRKELGVVPSYKRVDTCAAEFEAQTPYMYSSYDGFSETESSGSKKVLILGGGPNRIGQGIEFDYCCCHASFALR